MEARIPAADVVFHRRVPHREMAARWAGHDIFVQVSDFEGTSVSMLEAMAHGAVPVVTAASSGVADVIRGQENGFVVPIGDMAAMASTIARLANDQMLLANAGRAAYRTAQAYAMDLYASKFAQILDDVTKADENVDYQKRYGIYSPVHPLLVQRQSMEQQLANVAESDERSLKQLFRVGWKGLRRTKLKSGRRNEHRAA
jgi:hypothetical protein